MDRRINRVGLPNKSTKENDGRKKAWWVKKIEMLEAQLAEAGVTQTESAESSETNNEDYAQGFVDCMHRFQLLNKIARNNIHRDIVANGPGAVKRMKGSKFRGFSL